MTPVAAASFGPAEPGEDRPVRYAEVRLDPGWSHRLLVLDPHEEPLANVPVTVGGEPAGSTGPEGWLEIARPVKPTRIGLGEGYRILFGDLDPQTGEFVEGFTTPVRAYVTRDR